jgi:hypothetical protein
MMKKVLQFPFFAFLLGFFPIIALWNYNKSQIYPRDVLLSVGVTAAFVLIAWFLCRLLLRSADRASAVSSIVFLLVFSYGHVYNLIKDKVVFGSSIGFLKLLAGYAVLFIVLLFLALRVKKFSSDVSLLLNLAFIALITFNLAQITTFEVQSGRGSSHNTKTSAAAVAATPAQQEDLPDIYYIILDMYSRQDVLKDQLGYDNSGFIQALEDRGFYVADCANSNYDGTLASITSTLNYSYLNNTPDQTESGTALRLSMKDSKIRADLAAYGYTFVTGRGFSSEDDVNNSDIYLDYLKDAGVKDTIARAQFTRMYLETTLLRALFEVYYMDPIKYDILPQWLFISTQEDKVLGYASFWFNQTKYVFDQLETFPQRDGHYFVYAQINIPHQPFVFDANGNFKYTYNPENTAPYYLEQITYANKRTLQLVDALISKSGTPPIIIIQGDHGAHVLTTGLMKHKILNAYYVPEKMRSDLYETITPVNTFRLLLRDVFGQNISPLPDILFVNNENKLTQYPSACLYP